MSYWRTPTLALATLLVACSDNPARPTPTPTPSPTATPRPPMEWHLAIESHDANPVRFGAAIRFDGEEVYRSMERRFFHEVTLVRSYEERAFHIEFQVLSATRNPALYVIRFSVNGTFVDSAPIALAVGGSIGFDFNPADP